MTKKQEAAINFLVGQIRKKAPNFDPKVIKEEVIKQLEARNA